MVDARPNISGMMRYTYEIYETPPGVLLHKEELLLRKLLILPVITLTLTTAPAAYNDTDTTVSPIISQNMNLRHQSPITLTAKDANLSEILRVLAERSGMNFVVGEGVQREKITLILNKTPLDEAINLLVRAAGLSYEVIGNSVLIAEADKLKEEVGLSSYVIGLKYAKASEVAAMLKDLTSNVKVDEGGNRLVCYTSPRVILEIERIVKAVDHPYTLVLLETRLIEVAMDKLDQYGIKWSELTPVTSGVTYSKSQIIDGIKKDNWVKMPLEFNLKLDLLLQNGDARMLMNSKLTTTNNREASLHIGDIVPYTIQSYNMGGTGGAGGNLQIMKENVGVMITMTPHVNDENQITLNLAPEVSNIAGWKGQFGDIPLVRTRKANTTIRVENGQKVFLAGLLSEEKTLTVHRLPVLGDIPLLGLLFQNRREEVTRKNLIIEVIPRIINNPAELSRILEADDDNAPSSASALSGKKPVGKSRRRSRKAPVVAPPKQNDATGGKGN
jgi:type II secretory pathway component GspD/PulD (secretin)